MSDVTLESTEHAASTAPIRRGQLALPEDRRDYLRAPLLDEFMNHDGFFREWLTLLCYYERLLEALPRVLHPPVGGGIGQPEEEWEALDAMLERKPPLLILRAYRDRVKALCSRWGLRCDWAAAWVHLANLEWANRGMTIEDLRLDFAALRPEQQKRTALAYRVLLRIATGKAGKDDRKLRKRRLPWLNSFLRKSLRGQADLPSPPDLVPPHLRYQDRISKSEAAERFDFLLSQAGHSEESVQSEIAIRFAYDPLRGGNWANIRRRVVEEAQLQWAEGRRAILRRGFILQDTQPQLPTHGRWLFLRICPQTDIGRPLGWRAIAKREDVTYEAIRDVVIPLATELGLTLPQLPSGRPRRSS